MNPARAIKPAAGGPRRIKVNFRDRVKSRFERSASPPPSRALNAGNSVRAKLPGSMFIRPVASAGAA